MSAHRGGIASHVALRRTVKAFLALHTFWVFVAPIVLDLPARVPCSRGLVLWAFVTLVALLVSLVAHRPRLGAIASLAYGALVLAVGWSQDSFLVLGLYTSFAGVAVVLAAVLWRADGGDR